MKQYVLLLTKPNITYTSLIANMRFVLQINQNAESRIGRKLYPSWEMDFSE